MSLPRLLIILLTAGLFAGGVAALSGTSTTAGGTHGFVGAGTCETCHGGDEFTRMVRATMAIERGGFTVRRPA